jgi:UDP-N-acetylglucosamine 2-epimerase (non-hydrolysing)
MSSVVFVAGARPNFVKIAPLLRELDVRGNPFPSELVHTGQHYNFAMSGVFFEQLGIRAPDVHLDVGSASHGIQTGKIMAAFDTWLAGRAAPPRAVVVVGDVNSTLACALVAAKRGIPVAHVEAGLRSFDRAMPEEINRVVTDAVSDLLLVSEPSGMENLAREGIAPAKVKYVGNVMIDTLVHQLPAARALPLPFALSRGSYAVVTLHRPSNVDAPERLAALAGLLRRLAAEIPVVFPIHPRTHQRLAGLDLGRVHACAPLGYREFLGLVDGARLVLTDSGGIQEETTYLGIPCITLRTTTERPVTVTRGTNVLVGDDLDAAWRVVIDARDRPRSPAQLIDGWEGAAAGRAISTLRDYQV